jgi:hypothetical protein
MAVELKSEGESAAGQVCKGNSEPALELGLNLDFMKII